MDRKEERTVDRYLWCGAYMKLLKELFINTGLELQHVIPRGKMDAFHMKVDKALTTMSSLAEECMFEDHSDKKLPHNPINVFYGQYYEQNNEAEQMTAEKTEKILRLMLGRLVNNGRFITEEEKNYIDFANLVTGQNFQWPPSFAIAKAYFIGKWKSGKKNGWIPVSDRLPPENDTIFAKLKGTDKWRDAMFEKQSEDVRVVFRFEDGTRRVGHSHTVDGVWECEKPNRYPKRTVTHWCENPQMPEEE